MVLIKICQATEFILKHVQPALKSYQSSNIIIPMGRDFAYQEAEPWFQNIDKLIKCVFLFFILNFSVQNKFFQIHKHTNII